MANAMYEKMHEERLKLKNKAGNNLYKREGNDIVPADNGFVYPNLQGQQERLKKTLDKIKSY